MSKKLGKLYEERNKTIKDKALNGKWNKLTALGEGERAKKITKTKEEVKKEIFNLIANADQEPDFSRRKKNIRNEEYGRPEEVIYCINPTSDKIFTAIKEERGVSSMYGTSIDKDLKPIAKEIRALKEALNPSQIQSSKKDLEFNSMQCKGKEVNLQCRENKNNLNFFGSRTEDSIMVRTKNRRPKKCPVKQREMTESPQEKVDRLESERQQIQLQLSPSGDIDERKDELQEIQNRLRLSPSGDIEKQEFEKLLQDLEDKQSAIEEIQRNYDRNIEKIQELIKTVEQMKGNPGEVTLNQMKDIEEIITEIDEWRRWIDSV